MHKNQQLYATNNPLQCQINIKLTSLNQKCPVKQKIKRSLLPNYLNRIKYNHKQILKPSQDRLSELTTQQIDRIIHIEKIKQHLQEKKLKIKQIIINSKDIKNKHLNVYTPNFLAKVNRIAIKKNIRHLRSEQFDQNQQQVKLGKRAQQLAKQRMDTLKYQKFYSIDVRRPKTEIYEDTKSISSIQDNIQQFQKQLLLRKNKEFLKSRRQNKKKKGLVDNKWFSGMSKIYLQSRKSLTKSGKLFPQRSQDITHFDIQFMRSKQSRQRMLKTRNSIYKKAQSTMLTTFYEQQNKHFYGESNNKIFYDDQF